MPLQQSLYTWIFGLVPDNCDLEPPNFLLLFVFEGKIHASLKTQGFSKGWNGPE